MIEVNWKVCQRLMLQANQVFVQDTGDAWHLRFHSGPDDIYHKYDKSTIEFENLAFIETYLNKPNIITAIDIGIPKIDELDDDDLEEELEDDEVNLFTNDAEQHEGDSGSEPSDL